MSASLLDIETKRKLREMKGVRNQLVTGSV